jgi:hypothetical protein
VNARRAGAHAGTQSAADSKLIADIMAWMGKVRAHNARSAAFTVGDRPIEQIYAHIAAQLGEAHALLLDARIMFLVAAEIGEALDMLDAEPEPEPDAVAPASRYLRVGERVPLICGHDRVVMFNDPLGPGTMLWCDRCDGMRQQAPW